MVMRRENRELCAWGIRVNSQALEFVVPCCGVNWWGRGSQTNKEGTLRMKGE